MPGPGTDRGQYTQGSPASRKRAKQTTSVPVKTPEGEVTSATTTRTNARKIRRRRRDDYRRLAIEAGLGDLLSEGDHKDDPAVLLARASRLGRRAERQREENRGILERLAGVEIPGSEYLESPTPSLLDKGVPNAQKRTTVGEAALDTALMIPIARGGKVAAEGGAAAKKAAEQIAKTAEKGAPRRVLPKIVRRESKPLSQTRRGKKIAKELERKRTPGVSRQPVKGKLRRAEAEVQKTAAKAPEPVKKAGRAARATGRVASVPGKVVYRNKGKVTVGGPFAAQAPIALSEGDPSEFKKALTGEGVFATAVHSAADTGSNLAPEGIVRNAARDLIGLPADVVPSLYLTADAANAWRQGDSEKVDALWKEYKDKGFLTGIAKGDWEQALQAAEDHPVYSALEVSGAYAATGRGAGAVARNAPVKKIREAGSQKRDPKKVYGNIEKRQDYSANLLTKGAQVASEKRKERRGEDPNQMSGRERERYLRRTVDEFEGAAEGVRRGARDKAIGEISKANPSKRLRKGDEDVVSEVAQGLVRSKKTWAADIDLRIAQLKGAQLKGLTRAERAENRRQIEALEQARKITDPERQDAIIAAAEKYGDLMEEQAAKLVDAGLLTKDQATKAALIPYARVHMGADYKEGVGVVDAAGNPLSAKAIRDHMRQSGMTREPAFLTHRPGWRGKGSFYQPWASRSSAVDRARTGESTIRGTFDASWDALVEQVASATTKASRADTFDAFINRFAVRPKGGYFKDIGQAKDALRNPERYGIELPEGMELTPVRLTAPGKSSRETEAARRRGDPAELPERAAEALDPDADPVTTLERMLDDAVDRVDVGEGPVVLVPKQVVSRFREHNQSAGLGLRAAQALNSAFKGTVLPFSPRWIYGNMMEPFIRSVLAGLTPLDFVTGVRGMRRLQKADPDAYAAAEQRYLGGTLYGAAGKQRVHRDASQFQESRITPLVDGLTALGNAPGGRQLVKVYRLYRDAVFSINSRMFERWPQYAALGKEMRRQVKRDVNVWHKTLKLGDKALDDFVKGQRDSNAQVAYAEGVTKVFGDWYRYSPAERQAMMTFAPFYGWARASATFVFLTLPRHHPVKTALFAALERATEEERKAVGLSRNADEPVPPNLQGSIPNPDGGLTPVSAYSSFGSWSNPVEGASNFILPQMDSILAALRGEDWKGDELTDENGAPIGEEDRVLAAVKTFADGFLPIVGLSSRITQSEGVGDYFNPARPVDADTVEWLRKPKRTIRVPSESGSSSGRSSSSGSSGGWPGSPGSTSSGSGGWP